MPETTSCVAGPGNDRLLGGSGNDIALGGDGDDILKGQGGSFDTLDGGSGQDTYFGQLRRRSTKNSRCSTTGSTDSAKQTDISPGTPAVAWPLARSLTSILFGVRNWHHFDRIWLPDCRLVRRRGFVAVSSSRRTGCWRGVPHLCVT